MMINNGCQCLSVAQWWSKNINQLTGAIHATIVETAPVAPRRLEKLSLQLLPQWHWKQSLRSASLQPEEKGCEHHHLCIPCHSKLACEKSLNPLVFDGRHIFMDELMDLMICHLMVRLMDLMIYSKLDFLWSWAKEWHFSNGTCPRWCWLTINDVVDWIMQLTNRFHPPRREKKQGRWSRVIDRNMRLLRLVQVFSIQICLTIFQFDCKTGFSTVNA